MVSFSATSVMLQNISPLERIKRITRELRAALCSLQRHQASHHSLICLDSLLVANGVLGSAQRWRRHKWHDSSGAVKHVDLWVQNLDLVEQFGDEVK